jgi:hypothetical protein
MSNHLSSKQISELAAGESTPEVLRHCRECPECSSELARIENALSEFRSAMSRWASQSGSGVIPARDRFFVPFPAPRRRRRLWAPLAAAVAVLAVVPLYKNTLDRKREAQAIQDAVLLDRVNAQLSRTAPTSLEPLMDMLMNRNDSIPETAAEGGVR